MASIQCNWNGYYKNKTPKVGSIVFIKVNQKYPIKSTDIGIYVNMIEYDNLEALISITELTKYKVNLQTIFKPEKVYACVVLNEYKNKFDLSYIKVKKESKELLSECYEYLQRIVNIIKEYDIKNIITSTMLDHCYHENKNVFKEVYQNLLLNPELYIDDDKSLEEFKEHIIIKKLELYYNFQIEVFEDSSLNLLKEILNFINEEIKENNYDIQLYCKMSPIYSFRIKDFNRMLCVNLGDKLIEKIKEKYQHKLINVKSIDVTDITDNNKEHFSHTYSK